MVRQSHGEKGKSNLLLLKDTSSPVWFTVELTHLEMGVCIFSHVRKIGQKENTSSCYRGDLDCIVVKISSPKKIFKHCNEFPGKMSSHCPWRYLKNV